MTPPRRLLQPNLLFSLWLALVSVPLGAAEKDEQAVQLKIGTILATNQADCLDSQLSKMKPQLEVIKYRCYRLIREESNGATVRRPERKRGTLGARERLRRERIEGAHPEESFALRRRRNESQTTAIRRDDDG